MRIFAELCNFVCGRQVRWICYNTHMKLLFFALVSVIAVEAVAEKQPFERYQPIIDRQMFGELPPDFDPDKMPSEVVRSSKSGKEELSKEQEKLQSSVHFSVINIAADGTPVVGFTDNSNPKAPVHHYIKAGAESDRWKVHEVDIAEKSMTIEKDGVKLTLKLGDNSGKTGGGGGEAVPAVASSRFKSRRSGILAGGTLRRRQTLREEKLREQEEAAEKAREQDKAEREEQRLQLQELRGSLSELLEREKSKQNEGRTDAENNVE